MLSPFLLGHFQMEVNMKDQWYVVLYDGKGGKSGEYECKDAIDGISLLNRYGTKDDGFTYVSAACFYLSPNRLPIRQWFIEID
jgi:hypothetical protein